MVFVALKRCACNYGVLAEPLNQAASKQWGTKTFTLSLLDQLRQPGTLSPASL
jgi:hypothetical protein